MSEEYDVLVVGTGAAGLTVAHGCASAGKRTAITDEREFGGTCALRGCDPKKVLVGAASAVAHVRMLEGKGVAGDARIDWAELMAFKRTFTEPVPDSRESALKKAGIETLHGRARFVGRGRVKVGERGLNAKTVVLATGSRPRAVRFEGAELMVDSEAFLSLEALPRRIVFAGGGYISFEFAHVAARAGADVTILHRSAEPLKHFEPSLVDALVEASRELGVRIELGREVSRIERDGDALRVHTSGAKGDVALDADLVVHGAGRVPNVDDMGLDAADVAHDKNGVKVDGNMRSVSNPDVYAVGDVAARGPALTPVASHGGEAALASILGKHIHEFSVDVVPSVVFTIPPLASVGRTERDARAAGLGFDVNEGDSSGWYSSRRIGERKSGFKVLVERGSGRIVGAHLLGPHADEVINLFALAMKEGIPASALKSVLKAYPTNTSDVNYMV